MSSLRRPHARLPRRLVGAGIALVVLGTACSDDGRTLVPARPDQTASVSTTATTAAPPETAPGADGGTQATLPGTPGPLELSSTFAEGGLIDPRHTCDGANVSPPLSWLPGPAGTVEIAVSLVDEQNPDFVHWVMAGLDPLSTSLTEAQVPEFAITSLNSMGQTGYFGPCPPVDETHTYRFTVHFLIESTELGDGGDGALLLDVVRATAFAEASLTASYSRP